MECVKADNSSMTVRLSSHFNVLMSDEENLFNVFVFKRCKLTASYASWIPETFMEFSVEFASNLNQYVDYVISCILVLVM